MTEFKIGADPEFFLLDKETGKHVSAFNMIPGTKAEPFAVEGGAIQVDGMALEFNIDPATSFKQFDDNITNVLRQLREMVPERYEFSFVPVAHFGQDYIDAQPEPAKELGCDPDYNAWTGAINTKPDGSLGIRTASGHIHIGWTVGQDITHPDHIEACQMVSKQLDIAVGIPSLMWDTDTIRRTMYGDWGCYRPKHYGVEYRTLSNAWVNSKDLRNIVYANAVFSAQLLMQGQQLYKRTSPHHTDTQYSTNKKIFGYISEYIVSDPTAYDLMSKFRQDVTPRQAALDWKKKSEGHYFYHNLTYKQKHYSELTSEDWNTLSWSSGNYHMNEAKSRGWSYDKFLDFIGEKKKEESDSVKFSPWTLEYTTLKSPSIKKRKVAPIIIDDFGGALN